jgi:DNA-binding GntR family transcriptional regulator
LTQVITISQADTAYRLIRDQLITLQIAPGSAINGEALSAKILIGRTPVREALKRLATENLVAVYPRRGTIATDININDLRHIFEVRIPLEGLAAFNSAQYATPADIKDLEQIITLGRSIPTNQERLEADVNFHRGLYKCARNPFLEATLSQYLNLSLRILYVLQDQLPNLGEHLEEQREIVDALRTRNSARAQDIATHHLVSFREEMRSVL